MTDAAVKCIRRAGSYWSSCRCSKCHEEKLQKQRHRYGGIPWRVPNEVAWARLTGWIDAGWTARAIGSAVGLRHDYFGYHLARYRQGDQVLLGPVLAAKIMNAGRPTEGQVGAEPFRRRLRALAVIGWGLHEVAAETGVAFSTLAMIRNGNERVSARTAAAIADAYERMHMRPGPSAEASKVARRKSWPGPLAWDDIDDLTARPIGHLRRPLTRAEVLEELDEAGKDVREVCAQLRISREGLEQWCRRHGMTTLFARLVRRVDPDAYDIAVGVA